MLTPHLENLIHEGKALYKTAVLGVGVVSTIVVPDNSYAVITDILYYPYLDNNKPPYGTPEEMMTAPFINQVWIRSKLGNNHFVFRPSIGGWHVNGNVGSYPSIDKVQVNTYLIHDGVIKFSLSQLDSPSQWLSTDIAPLQDISNEESTGYGSSSVLPGLNVLKGVRFSNGEWYRPPTTVRDPQPANVTGMDQYRQNVSVPQTLVVGTNVQAIPILNIGYVQIQGKPKYLTS